MRKAFVLYNGQIIEVLTTQKEFVEELKKSQWEFKFDYFHMVYKDGSEFEYKFHIPVGELKNERIKSGVIKYKNNYIVYGVFYVYYSGTNFAIDLYNGFRKGVESINLLHHGEGKHKILYYNNFKDLKELGTKIHVGIKIDTQIYNILTEAIENFKEYLNKNFFIKTTKEKIFNIGNNNHCYINNILNIITNLYSNQNYIKVQSDFCMNYEKFHKKIDMHSGFRERTIVTDGSYTITLESESASLRIYTTTYDILKYCIAVLTSFMSGGLES